LKKYTDPKTTKENMDFPKELTDILAANKIELKDIPVLDLGNRGGSTDYIDFLSSDEMTAPIMQGIDKFNRRFMSFNIVSQDGGRGVITAFQRYTNSDKPWCIGGDVYRGDQRLSPSNRHPVPYKWLGLVVEGKNRFHLASSDKEEKSCQWCFLYFVNGKCPVCVDDDSK